MTARFERRIVLAELLSAEYSRVELATRFPFVMEIRMVAIILCPVRHITDVSAIQLVRSQIDRDKTAESVHETRPRLDPWSEMLVEPVAAAFIRDTTQTKDSSIVKATEALPTWLLDEIDKRRLLETPCDMRHLIDVSDTHVDLSTAELPSLTKLEYPDKPRLLPMSVTLAAPVTCRFDRRTIVTEIASAVRL